MKTPKLTKLELQILEALWVQGKASIREVQEAFPEPRPAYTTIQTTVYRLEDKKAVRRVRKIGNADIFEPTIAREVARYKINVNVVCPGLTETPLLQAVRTQSEHTAKIIDAVTKATPFRRPAQPDGETASLWSPRR